MLDALANTLPLPPAVLWSLLLPASLALLVKSADEFTDAAETVGLAIGLPHFFVGATIVAIGTSLPELVSSVIAVWNGSSEIVAGNVVGSNIANLLVVLGLAAVIDRHVRIKQRIAVVDLPFLLGSTMLLALVLWDGTVGRGEALVLLTALAVYLHYLLAGRPPIDEPEEERPQASLARPALVLVVCAAIIFLAAQGTVTSVVRLAEITGIGTEVLAASAVALGTSLPEIGVTVAAARRGNSDMAVGNVLGSNIFNTLAVTGIAALIGPLAVPASLVAFAVPLMVVVTVVVYFMIMQQEITRWEGRLLLLFYAYFLGSLFDLL